MKRISLIVSSGMVLMFVCFLSGMARAESATAGRTLIQRDMTYEEDLRWEASGDKTMTPARALRWIRGIRGAAIYTAGSPAQFQPIVGIVNSHIRAVATIAYKF